MARNSPGDWPIGACRNQKPLKGGSRHRRDEHDRPHQPMENLMTTTRIEGNNNDLWDSQDDGSDESGPRIKPKGHHGVTTSPPAASGPSTNPPPPSGEPPPGSTPPPETST